MNYQQLSDRELIERVRKGAEETQEAFRYLHQRWIDKVYMRSYRMMRNADDAQEITQEVFLSIYKMILRGGVQGEEPGRYIMRATSNACINALRRRNVGTRVIDDVIRVEKEKPVFQKDTAGTNAVLHLAIDALKPKERLLVIQKYFEKRTTQEIAEEAGRPKRVIDYHLERIRRLLFTRLTAAGITPEEVL